MLTSITGGSHENAIGLTPVVCRNTLFVTAVGAIGAALIAAFWIPVVFGGDFSGSVEPYLWLLPGTVALAGTKILAAYVFSRGKPLINAQIAFVTLLVTIVADLALIPPFEVAGAAAASSLAYCCSLALSLLAYRRISGGSIADAVLPRLSDRPYYVDGVQSLLGRLRRSEARP